MKINMMKPSLTEAQLVKGSDTNIVVSIAPRRWSAKQQALTVIPMEVLNNAGEVLDAGVLTVHQKTGRLALTRVSGIELDCEADLPAEKEKEKEKKDRKGSSL